VSKSIVADASSNQAPDARRLTASLATWHDGLREGVSFGLRCLVGLRYLRKQAGLFGLARVKGRPILAGEGEITIGSRLILMNTYLPSELRCAAGARIAIGRNVQINYGVLIAARQSVTIGDNVLVGNLSVIADTAFPTLPDQLAPADDPPQGIEIGNDVWLAARVTVLPGAKIGRGSVIGAGSVVRGTIPPGVVAMGNPARPLMRIGASRSAAVAAAGA